MYDLSVSGSENLGTTVASACHWDRRILISFLPTHRLGHARPRSKYSPGVIHTQSIERIDPVGALLYRYKGSEGSRSPISLSNIFFGVFPLRGGHANCAGLARHLATAFAGLL